ncbi:NAD-dependent epimerase/dehydratase family protein [Jiangella asiatica]|uniref:NAD-dependent epimerase/dehydratase family protein n=1 Tax=Jiangella asiatica TaxID=2530372 RepID=A0A4V2Z0M4_9ACTN|nr:NAD-dependent epimerase/dehydratase family protein [Jiangella asiatica]TDE01498.1 NAD-dependent epimerase/dehydratase family protein [Jiangella asiatica]
MSHAEGVPHAVVTGGAGFLGSHLCDALLHTGYRVTCIDNFETGRRANVEHLRDTPTFRLLRGDMSDGVEVDEPVDVIFHLAGPAAPSDYLLDPVSTMRIASVGTINALDLARDRSARFALASTSEIYGAATDEPNREDDAGHVNPADGYGAYYEARRFAEALTTAYHTTYNLPTAIARIFNTYGPRMRLDDGRMLSRFIRQALAGAPLTVPGSGSETRSLCYVDDAVAGIMALASGAYPGPVNIGSPDEVTILSIARDVAEIAGRSGEMIFVEAPPNEVHTRKPDISLALQLLGWRPRTSVRDGLADTLAWFRDAGVRHV